ncbi:MAG: hypothetical protein ACI8RA_002146 [Chlamydiales bacterium]|jgi:hypothetical protein
MIRNHLNGVFIMTIQGIDLAFTAIPELRELIQKGIDGSRSPSEKIT